MKSESGQVTPTEAFAEFWDGFSAKKRSLADRSLAERAFRAAWTKRRQQWAFVPGYQYWSTGRLPVCRRTSLSKVPAYAAFCRRVVVKKNAQNPLDWRRWWGREVERNHIQTPPRPLQTMARLAYLRGCEASLQEASGCSMFHARRGR